MEVKELAWKMEGKENCLKDEVVLKENSDGFQCTERLTKCKDAVCCIRALDGVNIRSVDSVCRVLDKTASLKQTVLVCPVHKQEALNDSPL